LPAHRIGGTSREQNVFEVFGVDLAPLYVLLCIIQVCIWLRGKDKKD